MKAFADDNFNVSKMVQFFSNREENIAGKGENATMVPAFSPFPTMFLKGFLFRVVKTRDCLGKGQVGFQFSKAQGHLDELM